MRIAYLDETGISAREPIAVVAGVVIQFDKQWQEVENHLRGHIDQFIPEHLRPGFVFHASELFSGGKVLKRGEWTDAQRWPILEALVAIPFRFKIPIVVGHFRKLATSHDAAKESIITHSLAYIQCIVALELFMRRRAEADEFVLVTAEDNQHARRAIKAAHRLIQDEAVLKAWIPPIIVEKLELPVLRVKDTVHFAGKTEAMMLQVADACAFVLRKHLEGDPRNERFLSAMFGNYAHPVGLASMASASTLNVCFDWVVA